MITKCMYSSLFQLRILTHLLYLYRGQPQTVPRVKRDSKEWYKRNLLRTGVERCIKRQKVDYQLEDSKERSLPALDSSDLSHCHVPTCRCLV